MEGKASQALLRNPKSRESQEGEMKFTIISAALGSGF